MERIGIIAASVREGRRGFAFAQWVHGLAATRANVAAELIDLRDWPIGNYTPTAMPMAVEATYAAGTLEHRWAELIRGFDAFVMVSPEYNHGYPGNLKNAIDALGPAWGYKPVSFVTYGGFGAGARVAEHLAVVVMELRMVVLRDQVNIRLVGLQTDDRGMPTDEIYAKRTAAMFDELVWFSTVLREARASRAK